MVATGSRKYNSTASHSKSIVLCLLFMLPLLKNQYAAHKRCKDASVREMFSFTMKANHNNVFGPLQG